MARKTNGRRCPVCGADVATLHRFCTRCGARLDPDTITNGSSATTHLIGKLVLGLLVLGLVAGVVNRLVSNDSATPTPLVEVAGNIDSHPTHTSVPPTRTTIPSTATERPNPTRTSRPDPTRIPTVVPTAESAITELASLNTAIATKPAKAVDVFAWTQTSIPRNPTRVSNAATLPVQPAQDAITPTPAPTVHSLAATDCSGYDAWEWAQSVYDSDPGAYAGLDPDGNGVACDGLGHGFAPAFWTEGLPDGIEIGTVSYLVDGDTYEIVVDGQSSRYRLYHADTPETYDPVQCGGVAATDFVRYVLQFSDTPQQVWIESAGQRDPYGRKLAYIWITIAGDPYLLNHVLINNGWAEDIDYHDEFDPYASELRAAADFAQRHQLGVWSQCGAFGVSLEQPASVATTAKVIPPTQQTQAQMSLSGGCDPNYIPCVQEVSYDLDCGDVGFRVQVIGYDRYRFDSDNDGIGCESY